MSNRKTSSRVSELTGFLTRSSLQIRIIDGGGLDAGFYDGGAEGDVMFPDMHRDCILKHVG